VSPEKSSPGEAVKSGHIYVGAVKRDRLPGEAEATFSGDALKPREVGTGMVQGFGTVVSG